MPTPEPVKGNVSAPKKASRKVISEQEVIAIRLFLNEAARSIRWKESVPDPAEHMCALFIGESSPPDILLRFIDNVGFPISISGGAITIDGEYVEQPSKRYDDLMGAALRFAAMITPQNSIMTPDRKFALASLFIGMWLELDDTEEPRSAFELHRMFIADEEANELLRQIRLHYTPRKYKDGNRFVQLDGYLASRPDHFKRELSPMNGNKLWSIK